MRRCHNAISSRIALWQREDGDVTELNVPNDERIGLTPSGGVVEKLRAALRGPLIGPDEPSYDEARTVWNAMIDRRPALIAQCRGETDVRTALCFAREHDLPVAVRGGGHNIAGSGVCDAGMVIDLSLMRAVHVDSRRCVAHVEPGCTLGEVDLATQAFGLAVPTGINSTTGIAGLTLGGGFGWLSRRHGLTIDNLIAADVVTADGGLLHANENDHSELFWGLRGGGGNFGVVTSFEFQLHPVGPEVVAGVVVHPLEGAAEVLRVYREHAGALPDESAIWMILRAAPPLASIPAAWHGRSVVMLAAFHAGSPGDGDRILGPFRSTGTPIADTIGPRPYTVWQREFDPAMLPGARNFWKSHDLAVLTSDALDVLVRHAERAPTPQCSIFVGQVGGAISRVFPSLTAYPHRAASFRVVIQARWTEPGQDDACVAWARAAFGELTPHATGGVYVNFLTEDEAERVTAAYGVNHKRLVRLKGEYDPTNLFRMNQNIRP